VAPRAEPRAAVVVRGPIDRADLAGLGDRLARLLAGLRVPVLDCDVTGVGPDAVSVDALARLALAARRGNCRVRLCHASDDLLGVIDLLGLAEVFGEKA
jgi:ABC-type transporter Mla MlaB component